MWKLLNQLFGWEYVIYKLDYGVFRGEGRIHRVYKDSNGNYFLICVGDYIFLDTLEEERYRWLTKEPENVRSNSSSS